MSQRSFAVSLASFRANGVAVSPQSHKQRGTDLFIEGIFENSSIQRQWFTSVPKQIQPMWLHSLGAESTAE